jgi:hypothetical protein
MQISGALPIVVGPRRATAGSATGACGGEWGGATSAARSGEEQPVELGSGVVRRSCGRRGSHVEEEERPPEDVRGAEGDPAAGGFL